MTLKSYWREDGSSPIISEDELIKRLSSQKSGIVFLSTVPSSDGETRVVEALEGEKNVKIFYCREIIEHLIDIIKKPHNRPPVDELCDRLRKYSVIIIRFTNRIYGLTSTIESISQICTKLAKESVIIVSGDHLNKYVPELLQQLPDAKQYYICY